MAKVYEVCSIKPGTSKKDVANAVRNELMQTVNGIIDGDWGGCYWDSWEDVFFDNLCKEYGFITKK